MQKYKEHVKSKYVTPKRYNSPTTELKAAEYCNLADNLE